MNLVFKSLADLTETLAEANVKADGEIPGMARLLAERELPCGAVDGWKLVPVEPTPEMVRAGYWNKHRDGYEPEADSYKAMLKAAPAAPGVSAAPACRLFAHLDCQHKCGEASCWRADRPAAPPTDPEQGCNCRWRGEEVVQRCDLHEAWHVAIHEWAERAKKAEHDTAALFADVLEHLHDEELLPRNRLQGIAARIGNFQSRNAAAPPIEPAVVGAQTMVLNYEPNNGRSFWHSDCTNHFGGIVREEHREYDRSLMKCLHCGKEGWYQKGWVGQHTVPVENVAKLAEAGVAVVLEGKK